MADNKLELILCSGFRTEITADGWTHQKVLPFLSVVQCCRGTYEISLDGGPLLPLEEGGLFITKPGQAQRIVHHFSADGKPMLAQWAFLSVVCGGFLDLFRYMDIPPVLSAGEARCFEPVLHALSRFSLQPGTGHGKDTADTILEEAGRMAAGYELLHCLLERATLHVPEEEYRTILPAIHRMDEPLHGTEKICLKNLAQACNLSVTGFTSRFRKLTGDSPMSFYMNRRLTRAATALLTGKKSLEEIAETYGFYDQFHLSREFKRRYGVCPRQYRKEFWQQNRENRPEKGGSGAV